MRLDLIEALLNAVVGFLISWLVTALLLGFSGSESVAITGLFFAISFVRSWVIRSLFRRAAGE